MPSQVTIYRDFIQGPFLSDFEWRGNINIELPDQWRFLLCGRRSSLSFRVLRGLKFFVRSRSAKKDNCQKTSLDSLSFFLPVSGGSRLTC